MPVVRIGPCIGSGLAGDSKVRGWFGMCAGILPKKPSMDKRAPALRGLSSRSSRPNSRSRPRPRSAPARRRRTRKAGSEDKYDMRSQSAAYLAAGQAKLATDIAEAIKGWNALPLRAFGPGDGIASGAVVTLEARGGGRRLPPRPPFGGSSGGEGRLGGRHRRDRGLAARAPADRPPGGRCGDPPRKSEADGLSSRSHSLA